jgi:hypothetical protein
LLLTFSVWPARNPGSRISGRVCLVEPAPAPAPPSTSQELRNKAIVYTSTTFRADRRRGCDCKLDYQWPIIRRDMERTECGNAETERDASRTRRLHHRETYCYDNLQSRCCSSTGTTDWGSAADN